MAEEDFSKPRNLADSLFGDFDLPEQSSMQKRPAGLKATQNKYEEPSDDDFFGLELGAESHFVGKPHDQTASSSSNSRKSQPQLIVKEEPKAKAEPALKAPVSRIIKKRAEKKAKVEEKKPEVDLDREIGEVAEWAERGAKNNSDDEDFNEADKVGESQQQLQMRRKIQQKLKNGFGQKSNGGGGGLRAKAEQLKKQNQLKEVLPNIRQQEEQDSNVASNMASKVGKKEIDPNESNIDLMDKKASKKEEKPKHMTEEAFEEEEDDPWDKVNQQTINQYNNLEEKRKLMNFQTVLKYYQTEFSFDEAEIDDDLVGKQEESEEESQEKGCLEALFACFKDDKPRNRPNKTTTKGPSLGKRLVAISKKQLLSGQEQFWLLKQIWSRLSGKPFSRYGSHWNEIGFQGRDPATDLRSTGVLSLLQWVQFIETHPKLAEKYYNWSVQMDYPLALTHIKLTGAFLDLLSKGKIKVDNWRNAQKGYNCLVVAMFKKIISSFKSGDTMGSLVEDTARELKGQYGRLMRSYETQFKDSK